MKNAPPFPLERALSGAHDLGKTATPAEMAKAEHADADPESVSRAASKAIAALLGNGPRQPAPHFYTASTIEAALRGLRDHAIAGDLNALNWYGYIVSNAVADLSEMARRYPEKVRTWSRSQNTVPVLTGKNKSHRVELDNDLEAYDVGAASPYHANPLGGKKAPDFSTLKNRIAGALAQHIRLHDPSLPDLTKRNAKRWAEVGWELILQSTDGKPENHPELKKLGSSKSNVSGRSGTRTKAADVRSEIFSSIKEAFTMIASAPKITKR